MNQIQTSIDIATPPERVWAVLTDFDAYPEWNPLLRSVRGRAEVGAVLDVRIELPGGRRLHVRPRVLAAGPRGDGSRELRWLGRLLVPGLIDGEHTFRVEPRAGGARLRQDERFSGVLRWLVPAVTWEGFEGMNRAVKERAEGLSGAMGSLRGEARLTS